MRLVRYILAVVTVLSVRPPAYAQIYVPQLNTDMKGVEAFVTAYSAALAGEYAYNSGLNDIRSEYTKASAYSTVVFATKYADRKALTNLGLWSSVTENYYYYRIRDLVAQKILPKLLDVGILLVRHPDRILYWAPRLYDICSDTKNLCIYFESVVTNSTLSFSDITFLQLCPQLLPYGNFEQIGSMITHDMTESITKMQQSVSYSKQLLKNDLASLYTLSTNLMSGNFATPGSLTGMFSGNISSLANGISSLHTILPDFAAAGQAVLSGMTDIPNIFQAEVYDMTGHVSDYINTAMGQYYTQKWYICRKRNVSETLTFEPTSLTTTQGFNLPPEYTIYNTGKTRVDNLSSSELEAVRKKAESVAGFSATSADKYKSMAGFYSNYNYSLVKYYTSSEILITSDVKIRWSPTEYHLFLINHNNDYAALSYSLSLSYGYSEDTVVDEQTYDSYTMDLATFEKNMNGLLESYKNADPSCDYYITTDDREYYEAVANNSVKGSDIAIVNVHIDEVTDLSSGSVTYDCDDCGDHLTEHNKTCSMADGPAMPDFESLQKNIADCQLKVDRLKSLLSGLQNDYDRICAEIKAGGESDLAELYRQRDELSAQIIEVQQELSDMEQALDAYYQSYQNSRAQYAEAQKNYPTIPSIMDKCALDFNLEWRDAGQWDNYTYVRRARLKGSAGDDLNYGVVFRASLRIASPPKYIIFGLIKIRWARIEINWTLKNESGRDFTYEIIDLIPYDTRRKKEVVQASIAAARNEYPTGYVTVDYAKTEPADDETEDRYHLLWSCDRLDIARGVEARLTGIYADLISVEKFLSFDMNTLDMLLLTAPIPAPENRYTIASAALARWRNSMFEKSQSK